MRVHDREPIGAALRRFKKLIERSGLKREMRAHEYYEKPCEERSRKEARRRSTIRKAALGKPPKKVRPY
jgi:small subunit ribosomal protein S21